MQCKNCKSSFAQHELRNELCLECTAKELANVRVHEAHLEDGLRAAEGELATVKVQHDEAIARDRQLREALSALDKEVYDTMERDEYEIDCVTVREEITKAISTPAPRVFTLADVRPLVKALEGCVAVPLIDIDIGRVVVALTHARKIGMEGA